MPRTAVTVIALPSAFALAPSSLTWTAVDAGNGNKFAATGREIILVRNTSVSAARLFTVVSVALNGRTGDATQSIPATAYRAFQMFPTEGWQQSDGFIYIDGASADLEVCIIKVP